MTSILSRRERKTQKPRSAEAIRAQRLFWANVASCSRRARSTIACLHRLRKKVGMTARGDRREFEQVPHSEAHSARGRCSMRD
jgi:hypothetical protein